MKKIFSISFALLILLSGMNLTIAFHICGKKVEAVKWSFTGKKAGCGMESDKVTCPAQKGFSKNCCQDKTSFYSIDNNYKPSNHQNTKSLIKNLRNFYFTLNNSDNFSNSYISDKVNVVSSERVITNSVYLPEICVFRI